MRGIVAKRIRKRVYGDDMSPRAREYKYPKVFNFLGKLIKKGSVKADERRRLYQQQKKAHTRLRSS